MPPFTALTASLIFAMMSSPISANASLRTLQNKEQRDDYEAESFPAPNGRLSIRTLQNTNRRDDDAFIQLIQQPTKRVLFSLHLHYAHGIDALWSPDSQLVAISLKDRPRSRTMTLLRVSRTGLAEIARRHPLTIECLLTKNDPARRLVFQHHATSPLEWRNSRDLICQVEGVAPLIDPKAPADGAMPTQGYLFLAYRVILRCDDKVTILKTERIERETNQ